MKIRNIIIYVLAVSVLFISLWGCAKQKDRSEEETDSNSASSQSSISTIEDIATKDEKEVEKGGAEGLQKQVEEVRETFMSLQEVCKAKDIEGYIEFCDDETKMEIDGRDMSLEQRRERRRKSLTKDPGTLQEIANAKIESITVNTSEAEKIGQFFGGEIKGTMLLVRTDGRALLFHETAKGWKLFSIGSPGYYR
jgi:hypothetical protein